MKNRSLISVSLLCGLFLILFACRKDINHIMKGHEISNSDLESAKIYHSMNAKTAQSQKGKRRFIKLKPLWSEAWSLNSYLIVPTIENHIENSRYSVKRIFLFSNRNGKISNGQIIEFIGQEYDVEANLDHLVKNLDKSSISGFTGAIIYYDINYYRISSSVYANGKKTENEGGWVSEQPSSSPIPIASRGKIMTGKDKNRLSVIPT